VTKTSAQLDAEIVEALRVVMTPTARITIVNEDVLASARMDLQRLLNRRRYPSREAWAEEVLADSEPVDLYRQKDGSLALLDGNHRYLAATILHVPLRTVIHG
jgi:hypothetical protein